jgi:hypothetical protein
MEAMVDQLWVTFSLFVIFRYHIWLLPWLSYPATCVSEATTNCFFCVLLHKVFVRIPSCIFWYCDDLSAMTILLLIRSCVFYIWWYEVLHQEKDIRLHLYCGRLIGDASARHINERRKALLYEIQLLNQF